MHFTKLVPNIFYVDIKDGLKTFVDCLHFEVTYSELESKNPFCVVERDGLRINLFQDKALAQEHHPEFRLVTENIQEVYDEISMKHKELLHPNLSKVTRRPWGALEFAITDTQLGIVFQQW